METPQLSKTIEYLTDAAHFLHETAPETAAHLMAQRRDLMYEHKLSPHENQRQHVCGACGNIMIPGTGSTFRFQRPRHGRKKPQPSKPTAKSMTKTITCGMCDGKTRIGLTDSIAPVRYKSRKAPSTKAKSLAEATSSTGPDQLKLSSNAGSKKRAKNRKAGLQALLSGQRQQQSNPLSLADFMKK
uniref:Uncharacterized protein n=1 Tax=Bionectria ochroleuca TaxID=29856 RepID=A0A8H7NDM6_BIOOC